MRTHYEAKDLRTLRLLHEYGFTDAELAEHLGLSPLAIRHMRTKVGLQPNGVTHGIAYDRRTAASAARMHPAQAHFGGQGHGASHVLLKLVDDRYFVEA